MSLTQQLITTGTMKLWHDYSKGSLVDLSGNANDGAFINTPYITREGVKTDGVSEYIRVTSDASLSFGNATTDTPFTFIVKIKNLSSTAFLLHKTEDSSTTSNLEYVFRLDSSQRLLVRLYDASTGGYLGQYADAGAAMAVGKDYTLAVTYDGGETSAGIALYSNGLLIDSTADESGAYTAMEALNKNVGIGRYDSDYSKNTFEQVMMIGQTLTATEIAQITGELDNKKS